MADINVPLLVALGDRAAPQHKVRGQEAFEFSEGSDGALHTKIVDQNGNPISSENKLQVADADVKTELEQIKQQQQQILQRLNQPIDTQLTGSLKEYLHEQDVEVTAMAYRNGKRFTFDSRVNYFTVGVLSNEDHDFSIFLNWMNEGGDIMEYRKEEFLSEGQRRLLSPVIKVKTKTMRVDIRNKSNDDMLYDVFLNIS